MTHHMEVALGTKPATPLLDVKYKKIGPRLWRWLFGNMREIVILAPAASVEAVTIIEQPPKDAGGAANC